MKISRILLIPICVLFLFSVRIVTGEDDLGYGVHLYKKGNYTGAILELERYIYHNSANPKIPYIKLLLSISYAKTQQYNKALSYLSDISSSSENITGMEEGNTLSCESKFHRLSLLFRQKRFSDFHLEKEDIFITCVEINPDLENYINLMSTAGYIYELRWENALGELSKVGYNLNQLKTSLESEISTVLVHRNKSPLIGGLLSIVPGLGQMYAGRFPDGIRSLLFNTAFASLTIFSFKEDMVVLGGIFGTIELVLYISNLYGGVNAVMQENARYVIQKRDEMLKEIPAPPLDVITVRKELNL